MSTLGRIEDPVVIKLSHLGNKLLPLNGINEEVNFDKDKGVVLGSDHYGIVLVIDEKNRQREEIYRTDDRITAIGLNEGILSVYEDNKKFPWKFKKNGEVIESNNPTKQFGELIRNVELNEEGHLIQNDGHIVVTFNKSKRKVQIKAGEEVFEIYKTNAIAFGEDIFGITIIIQDKEKEERKEYLTEDSIYGLEYSFQEDELRVYEKDKYNPWRFDSKGNLIEKASYNKYSRRDKKAYEEKYGKKLV